MAAAVDESSGEWMTVTQLSLARGVTKAAISRRVARLEAAGAITTRLGPRNSKLIPVADFGRAVEEFTDLIREANGRRSAASRDVGGEAPGDPVLAREQAKRAAADAELKRMDLEERRERIVSAEQYERFVDTCSANAQTVLWRLPGLVEDIIAIANRDGVAAAKTFVKGHVREAIAEVGALMRIVADPRTLPDDGAAAPVETSDANVPASV